MKMQRSRSAISMHSRYDLQKRLRVFLLHFSASVNTCTSSHGLIQLLQVLLRHTADPIVLSSSQFRCQIFFSFRLKGLRILHFLSFFHLKHNENKSINEKKWPKNKTKHSSSRISQFSAYVDQ